jgi:integrase
MSKLKAINAAARELVAQRTTHGIPRSQAKRARTISSVGTERTYRQQVKTFHVWRGAMGLPFDGYVSHDQLIEYLEQLAEIRSQKGLDQARQALQVVYDKILPRIESELPERRRDKYIARPAMEGILANFSERHSLSAMICLDGGLRASELLTLRRRHELQPTAGRDWSANLFLGRADYQLFCVEGKGGLVRAVALNRVLAEQLEQHRFEALRQIRDREINRWKAYDIPGGQNFSNYFSKKSFEALRTHYGAHSLRHTWAQNRFNVITQHVKHAEAMRILSQECGHFRPQVTFGYLW